MREGVPNDEQCDLGDEEVLSAVWTGVLPLSEQFGEPVPGPYNRVWDVPEHVTEYREKTNRENWDYAEKAARKSAPVKRKEDGDEE